MRTPKYPLELVRELRKKGADEAGRALAAAAREREAAERRVQDAELKSDAHAARARRVRSAERQALARGELSVADLSRADCWEARIKNEKGVLSGELVEARTDEGSAQAAEQSAREEYAARKAGSDLVAEHRVRWNGELHKRREADEEEACSEAWLARASKPKA